MLGLFLGFGIAFGILVALFAGVDWLARNDKNEKNND